MKKYGVPIIVDVGNGIAPDAICVDLGLCDSVHINKAAQKVLGLAKKIQAAQDAN